MSNLRSHQGSFCQLLLLRTFSLDHSGGLMTHSWNHADNIRLLYRCSQSRHVFTGFHQLNNYVVSETVFETVLQTKPFFCCCCFVFAINQHELSVVAVGKNLKHFRYAETLCWLLLPHAVCNQASYLPKSVLLRENKRTPIEQSRIKITLFVFFK